MDWTEIEMTQIQKYLNCSSFYQSFVANKTCGSAMFNLAKKAV